MPSIGELATALKARYHPAQRPGDGKDNEHLRAKAIRRRVESGTDPHKPLIRFLGAEGRTTRYY